jgi:hypothetical protein
MERSGQMLFWTIVGSLAAVLTLLIGLKQCSGGSAPSTASPPSSTAVSTPTSTISVNPQAARPPVPNGPTLIYLANMTPAGDLGQFVTQGPVVIHGTTYPNSIAFEASSPGDTPGTFSLNGTATIVQATVGVKDNWPSDYVVGVSVVGDGHTLKTLSVSVLKPQTININVTGVYRLELDVSFAVDASGTGGWNVEVAWGDARVVERG